VRVLPRKRSQTWDDTVPETADFETFLENAEKFYSLNISDL